MARLPRYPLTVFDNIYARGHQSLARDQLEYCNLITADGQKVYHLTREQRALPVSRMNRRNSKLSDALHKRPVYSVGGWVWLYDSAAATIRQSSKQGARADVHADAQVLKVKLSLKWSGPLKPWLSIRWILRRITALWWSNCCI